MSSRRYLVFVLGKFRETNPENIFLGYAKHLDGEKGENLTEICLIPVDSVIDYFMLIKAVPVTNIV